MENLLPHYRRIRKIKQSDMARDLDVSPSFLCKVEKGLVDPSVKFRTGCSVYLDVPEDILFPRGAAGNGRSKSRPVTDTDMSSAMKNKLWQIRTGKGIKQYELARLLSCSPSFLSKVEKGLQDPGDDFKKKCARIFKIKQTILFP